MDLRAPKLTDVDSRLWPWPLATHKIAGCHTLSSAAFLPFSTSSCLHDAKDIEKVLVKLLIKTIRQGCCSAMSTETSRKFLPGRSKHYTCVSWSVGQDNMGQQRVDGKWWEGKATFGGLAFTRDSLPGLITLSMVFFDTFPDQERLSDFSTATFSAARWSCSQRLITGSKCVSSASWRRVSRR